MTEKRFKWVERIKGNIVEEFVVDNLTNKELDEEDMCELLNELDKKYVDEFALREILQQELQRAEEENKQLKQYLSHLEYRFTEYRIKVGDKE